MKILQINAVSTYGSTGRTTTEMANYLNENGFDSFVAYAGGTPYEKGLKIGTKLEMKLHALGSRITGKQAYFSKSGTKKLLAYIDKIQPDIVHLRNLHGNFVNLKLLLSYLSVNDVATVLTLHDCWFFTGKCTHYTIEDCYKWQSSCGGCPRLRKDNPSWFFDKTTEMYLDKKELFESIPRLAVVGVSKWITEEARTSLLATARCVRKIYNWVDLDIFKPSYNLRLREKLNLKDKFVILGVASGWSSSKGVNKFIKLSYEIDDSYQIVLVGRMNLKIELPTNIISLPRTDSTYELAEYYSMADVFINFSMEESFGKVTAESLACGTPVIVLNSTANPELVGERCGYVADEDHPKDILDILKIIQEKGKEYYSDNCVNYAKNNFNKADRIQDYINLYNELV